MKIYPQQNKTIKGSGNFFFGDYGEIPIEVSYTTVDENNISENKDTKHFHKEGYEFYFTIDGRTRRETLRQGNFRNAFFSFNYLHCKKEKRQGNCRVTTEIAR